LRNIKEKYWAKYILVAHHLDDKIETFLLNLIRWTKLKWLISIEEKNEDILRPLLPFSKSEIIEKAKKLWLKWREDKSNLDEKYLRNNIRLNILPLFDQINSSYKKSFENIMSYMWEIKTYFDEQIKKIIINNEYFEIETFNNFPEFLQREVIRYVFEITNFWTIGLSEGNIKEVIKFINDKWNYTKKEIKKMSLFKKNWKIYLM
jgi:tRNA(Ile)-lysidine synthase